MHFNVYSSNLTDNIKGWLSALPLKRMYIISTVKSGEIKVIYPLWIAYLSNLKPKIRFKFLVLFLWTKAYICLKEWILML